LKNLRLKKNSIRNDENYSCFYVRLLLMILKLIQWHHSSLER